MCFSLANIFQPFPILPSMKSTLYIKHMTSPVFILSIQLPFPSLPHMAPAAAAIMSYPLLFHTGCAFSLLHASKLKCLFRLKFLTFILYVTMSNLSFSTLCYLLTKVRWVLPCYAFLSQSQIMGQSHSVDKYALAVSLSSVGSLIPLFTTITDKPHHSSQNRPR